MKHLFSTFRRNLPALLLPLVCTICLGDNHTLYLPGNGKAATIPDVNLGDNPTEGTIEFWYRPEGIPQSIYLFSLGNSFIKVSTNLQSPNDSVLTEFQTVDGNAKIIDTPTAFDWKWTHMAVTWNQDEVGLYLNGRKMYLETLNTPLQVPQNPVSLLIGSDTEKQGQTFRGHFDQIKIWKTARTEDQIKSALFAPTPGQEKDLASSYEFEGNLSESIQLDENVHMVPTPTHNDWEWGTWRKLEGVVKDAAGTPVKRCEVWMEDLQQSVLIGNTDADGIFECFVNHLEEGSILRFRNGRRGAKTQLETLGPGMNQSLEIILRDHISISGFVRGLDEETPIQGVFVEALDMSPGSAGKIHAVGLTDQIGSYELTDLDPGDYVIRIRAGKLAKESTHEEAFGVSSSKLEQFVSIKDSTAHQRIDLICPPCPQWNLNIFTTLDGLPGTPVLSVSEGAAGNIWVGSLSWICSYTGQSFNVAELDLKSGTNIPLTTSSRTTGNVCVYAYEENNHQLVFVNKESLIGAIQMPSSLHVKRLEFDESGGILFGNENGIFRLRNWREHLEQPFNPSDWEQFKVANASVFVAQPQDHIWAVGRQGLFHILPDKTFEIFTHPDLTQVSIRDIQWHPIEQALWLATSNGLGILKNGELTWELNDKREWSKLKTLLIDSKGTGWIGTESNGLLRSSDEGIVQCTGIASSFQDQINEIAEGAGNSIWVAGVNGLYHYQESQLQSYTTAHGLPKARAFTIGPQQDANRVWIGMEWRGPSFYDGYQFKLIPENSGINNAFFRDSGYTSSGKLWMCLQEGLAFFEKDQIDWVQVKGLGGPAWAVTAHETEDNNFFIGRGWAGSGAVLVNSSGQPTQSYTKEHGLPDDQIWEIFERRDGSLLLGTVKGVRQLKDGKIEKVEDFDRLTTTPTYSFASSDDGTLWAATGEGVFKIQNGVESPLIIPGLPESFMTWKVMVDNRKVLWIGTEIYGLIAYDGQRFSQFNTHNGLPSNAILDIKQAPNESIWLATQNGVAQYKHTPYEPGLRIESLQIGEQSHPNISHAIPSLTGIPIYFQLEWNHLFHARDDLMIVGHIRNETSGATESLQMKMAEDNSISWTPKTAGSYVLECQLSDPDLNHSPPTQARVDVSLPWHQDTRKTAPLAAFSILIFGGLTLGAARGYIHRRQARKYQAQLLVQERQSRKDLETKNEELRTAREEALAAMHSAEKANQAKSIFVANMSHEIRSPLNAVLGYAQILRQDHATNPSTMKALGVIAKSGQHLLQLINDMLELSKIESGTMEITRNRFDLISTLESVSDIIQITCTEKYIEWSIRWFEGQPFPPDASERHYIKQPQAKIWIHADEAKLRQILLNLLSNAAKYTDQGEIHLEIGMPPDWRDMSSQELITKLFFEINDTGIGISTEDQANILKPFIQGSGRENFQGGVGLGLSIAKRLVELFEGQLEYKSKQGVGSQFYFTATLPMQMELVSSSLTSKEPHHEQTIEAIKPTKALVVDDIETNRDLLERILADYRFEVRQAADGPTAINIFQNWQPDAVFMDISMPGMDGFEVVKQMKLLTKQNESPTTYFAVTAVVLNHSRDTYLNAGFDEFIGKPIDVHRLMSAIISTMPKHFQWKSDTSPVIASNETLQLDEAEKAEIRELANNYATSGILRITKAWATSSDPKQQANARIISALAENGNMNEIIRLLDAAS